MADYKHLEIVQDFDRYVRDKKVSSRYYYRYLLSRVLKMFQYKNLPDTIPHEILDRYLFEYGVACITKVGDDLYCFYGNLGGEQDAYYRPSKFIVANPHIKDGFNAEVDIVYPSQLADSTMAKENTQPGVLMRNDADWVGLHPLLARYAYLLAENTLTIRTADVMLRVVAFLTANTDKERASCLEYLKVIDKGEMGVIGNSPFFDGVKLQAPPSNNGSYLTQFIELQQYLKGSFFNEIGLVANYNMKREAIGKGESTLDTDSIFPLAENMLYTRREDIEKVNMMYGTNIEVDFSSSWLSNHLESIIMLKNNMKDLGTLETSQLAENVNNEEFTGTDTEYTEETNDSNEEYVEYEEFESNETEENSESEVNDESVNEDLTEMLEEIENLKENLAGIGDELQKDPSQLGEEGENNEPETESTENKDLDTLD